MIFRFCKRMFDVVAALLGLVILLPVCCVVGAVIKLESPGPVLFKQPRMGLHMKPFTIYKFRTMYEEAPKDCATRNLENSGSYITPVGKFLRNTSIDEIPQLINILKGEMSFIGPRPVVLSEIDLIQSREGKGVYDVKPGLSGWAQINGRDLVSVEDKTSYDTYYVDHYGFKMDMLIFLKTILYVLKRADIQEGKTKVFRFDKQTEESVENKAS